MEYSHFQASVFLSAEMKIFGRNAYMNKDVFITSGDLKKLTSVPLDLYIFLLMAKPRNN